MAKGCLVEHEVMGDDQGRWAGVKCRIVDDSNGL